MTLKPYEIKLNDNNPRTIKDDKFKKLVKSLKDFPEMATVREVVINKDHVVLGGNMRLRAMIEAGWDTIPVKIVDWSEEKQKEFIAKDNLGYGDWDYDMLANDYDLEDLEEWGMDIPDDLKPVPEIEEDEAPEVDESDVYSQPGEVYLLGRHRLMCGDSTNIEDVEKLMDGNKADMVLTDPPYGIDVVQNNSVGGEKLAKTGKYSQVIGDDTIQTAVDAYNLCVSLGIEKLIFWGGNYYSSELPNSRCWIIWNKKNTGNFADAELAWTNLPNGVKLYEIMWNGMIREGESEKRVHPTQKPIKLMANIIEDYSGNKVLDLFGGSGSTLIACEQTDRTCYMMELDPRYIQVILDRWEKFTGQDAIRVEDGKKWKDIRNSSVI